MPPSSRLHPGALASSLPTDKPVSVQELLGRHVELSAPATRKDSGAARPEKPLPAPRPAPVAALAQDAERYK